MESNKTTSFIIFFTSVLTFFLLWVFYADKVKDLYVKNVLEWSENQIVFNETLDVFWRKDLNLEDFWKTYNLIRANYIDIDETEKVKLEQWAIKWLVDSLWDIHSEYLDPVETDNFNKVLTWDFEWIGAVVDTVDLWIVVERVLKWSPALESWVRNWDIILEANNEKLLDFTLYEAVDKIKWPAGTTVLLKILRSWERDFLEIEVTRQKIVIPSVESEVIEGANNFYIALNVFWETSSEEFLQALEESKSYDGLIIDLRDNGGGYLESAVEILSEFIESWETIVSTRYRDAQSNLDYKSRNNGNVYDKKIVILINGNSASASEIVAWALHDYNKAILIWEQSYGKWSVQQPFTLDDGALLKLTIAKWLTPKWKDINKDGLEPDIIVEFQDEDYDEKYDRQLEEAKKLLNIYVENNSIWLTLDTYVDSLEQEEE